ncbi:hypothetical protein K503DRAFT_851878 [Rhizopogon vinicolor AM-OR11-026]|uniref:Integral membrane protein n=1 Tax=Rhizopogon vinicolor AM-OR11-026 TaxID=1314800 RepID=A0A1B7MLR6_9AGAM|nr:hypothetical protein K503DRAFT_851878 [Rhizopogon vinicolor AM-OR11-026]
MVLLYLDSSRMIVVGVVSHSIAILSTIFRLVYQTWTRRFWWEDAWAALALFSDIICLACIWVDVSISARILVVTLTSVLWAARMSIIFSIIRITRYSVSKVQRQATYLIAVSFACMWTVILVQKMIVCTYHSCQMGQSVALSQLITDVIADASLVVVPLRLWKNVGLTRGRNFLVLSIFSSSLLITVVTIPHSITIFRTHSAAKIIFAHIKAALSLFICNLLVIVTFAYRACSKEVDQSFASRGLFTSIVMVPYSSGTIPVSIEDRVDWGYEAAEGRRRERAS